MKMRSIAVCLSAGVALAFLSFGPGNAHAAAATQLQTAGNGFVQPPQFQQVNWEEAKIEKLQRAHYLLEHADGDYGGHRVAAMKSIKKAAAILGVELSWKGHGEESQWKSDRRLREAKTLLEGLADETKGKEQPHVHRAIKELDKALALK